MAANTSDGLINDDMGNRRDRPFIYPSVGFSLCWVSLEPTRVLMKSRNRVESYGTYKVCPYGTLLLTPRAEFEGRRSTMRIFRTPWRRHPRFLLNMPAGPYIIRARSQN